MRHHNPTSTSCFRRGKKVYKPYYSGYIDSYKNSGFKNANSKKRYVQILQYIADHDGCKRIDVIRDVYSFWSGSDSYHDVNAKDTYYTNKRRCRGHASNVFSQLLYIDVIDYDKSFRYHITDRGRKVLKIAYLNDCAKIMKGK